MDVRMNRKKPRFALMNMGLALACGLTVTAAPVGAAPKGIAMLPNRLLQCRLGHATNLDPDKNQRSDEVTFDSYHEFSLFLPMGPVRTTPPPDATEKPEHVNRATRIVLDPDGLSRDSQPGFERVIDLWPDRVEMTKTINQSLTKLIVISDIDAASGTAKMFMTNAADLTNFDFTSTYLGDCNVSSGRNRKVNPLHGTIRPK